MIVYGALMIALMILFAVLCVMIADSKHNINLMIIQGMVYLLMILTIALDFTERTCQ